MRINYDNFFDELFALVLEKEGGYVNHPNDRGGATMYGITERLARKYKYTGSMRDLPLPLAKKIYYLEFWVKPRFHRIAETSQRVASFMFLSGILVNTYRMGTNLQKVLNAFNKQGTLYEDLKEDSLIGDKTIKAFETYAEKRGVDSIETLLKGLNVLLGEYFIFLARRDYAQEDFVYGWIAKRIYL